MKKPRMKFFGTSLFLRPSDPDLRKKFMNESVIVNVQEARKNPGGWECLMMKRNYADFGWDSIGGNNNLGEFPRDTMVREVKEEMGWELEEYVEVTRQWNEGKLEGFVYISKPKNVNYMADDPVRVPCFEVQMVKYFTLTDLVTSTLFLPKIKGRINALIHSKTDFNLQ